MEVSHTTLKPYTLFVMDVENRWSSLNHAIKWAFSAKHPSGKTFSTKDGYDLTIIKLDR